MENYPGFPDGIMGGELTEKFREQSKRFGTEIFTETVNSVDLSKRPFVVRSDEKEVEAQTVVVATGAVARRMVFPGSGEGKAGYWNKVHSLPSIMYMQAPGHLTQRSINACSAYIISLAIMEHGGRMLGHHAGHLSVCGVRWRCTHFPQQAAGSHRRR